jgi:hypothetical protein
VRPRPRPSLLGRAARPARRGWGLSGLGADFWVVMLLFGLAMAWGVMSLIQPGQPERLPAILGYRDPPRPTPTPAPTPSPEPTAPS